MDQTKKPILQKPKTFETLLKETKGAPRRQRQPFDFPSFYEDIKQIPSDLDRKELDKAVINASFESVHGLKLKINYLKSKALNEKALAEFYRKKFTTALAQKEYAKGKEQLKATKFELKLKAEFFEIKTKYKEHAANYAECARKIKVEQEKLNIKKGGT